MATRRLSAEEFLAQPEPSIPEQVAGTIGRTAVRTPLQIGEAALGTIPDIVNLPLQLAGRRGLPSQIGTTPADIVRNQLIQQQTGQEVRVPQDIPLPTTQNIRSITRPVVESLTGSLEPQNSTEEFIEDFFDTVTPMVTLGATPGGSALVAGRGSLAKWGAKELGMPEWAQEVIKMGTMLIPSFFSRPRAESTARQIYTQLNEHPALEGNVSNNPLAKPFEDIQRKINIAPGSRENKFLRDRLQEVERFFNQRSNTINLGDAWNIKKEFNALRDVPPLSPAGNKLFGDLKRGLNSVLKTGEAAQKFPDFAALLTQADELKSGIDLSGKVSQFFERHGQWDKLFRQSRLLPAMFAGTPYVGKLSGLGLLPALGTGAAIAGKYGNRLIQALTQNPSLRNLVGKFFGEILRNNSPQAVKTFGMLDKAFNRMFPDEQTSGFQTRRIDPSQFI